MISFVNYKVDIRVWSNSAQFTLFLGSLKALDETFDGKVV